MKEDEIGAACNTHGIKSKRPLRCSSCGWKDGIKYLKGTECMRMRIGFNWLRVGFSAGSSEHGNKSSHSMKHLSNKKLLEKDCASRT
jgi:hypothetical protein